MVWGYEMVVSVFNLGWKELEIYVLFMKGYVVIVVGVK